ncbi:hypothetical protein WDJ51_07165, partial [Rathayibacter sp. YIM 133350]|uniref:hypothetical protein n=1 Tax=Rathayibacter sp. YIM 133350 TaxID=3131992 RepID=UPI00307D4645
EMVGAGQPTPAITADSGTHVIESADIAGLGRRADSALLAPVLEYAEMVAATREPAEVVGAPAASPQKWWVQGSQHPP